MRVSLLNDGTHRSSLWDGGEVEVPCTEVLSRTPVHEKSKISIVLAISISQNGINSSKVLTTAISLIIRGKLPLVILYGVVIDASRVFQHVTRHLLILRCDDR